ncbi:uncharacterized protein UV8b_00028 [Ustilaginoidea virens]|uniref:Uncharacterized protein n=1 Tax=Ustilaginoidea virens TaxID=1159556 RepID=A0A8E5MDZ4_USTVR|nr:uncharacterized protein UV8b_00028 [Ustilaginoidea virens]QUC15787.1 hypothetical protein UV8b_00028 [Ustilaginoidea virens]
MFIRERSMHKCSVLRDGTVSLALHLAAVGVESRVAYAAGAGVVTGEFLDMDLAPLCPLAQNWLLCPAFFPQSQGDVKVVRDQRLAFMLAYHPPT